MTIFRQAYSRAEVDRRAHRLTEAVDNLSDDQQLEVFAQITGPLLRQHLQEYIDTAHYRHDVPVMEWYESIINLVTSANPNDQS